MHARAFLKELACRSKRDRLWDTAAALAFFTVLAIPPFALAVASLATFRVSAGEAGSLLEGNAPALAPTPITELLGQRLASLSGVSRPSLIASGATIGLLAGATATSAAARALNAVYQVVERRSFWRAHGVAVLWTAITGALLLVAAALVVSGGRGPVVGGHALWWTRYVASGAVMMLCWALLYRFLPDVEQRFRFITAGSMLGVVLWIGGSWALSFYLAHAKLLSLSYGGLLGMVVLMAWVWVTSFAFVLGAEINAIVEHLGPSGKTPGGRHLDGT